LQLVFKRRLFSGGVFVLNSILLPSKGFNSKMFFEQAILNFYPKSAIRK